MQFKDLPKVVTPWSSVGYLTYKRTYSRKFEGDEELLAPDAPTEEFEDTVLRTINAADTQFNCGFTSYEEYRLAEYFLKLKASVAGRFWWQAGTGTVEKLGLASLQNCAFTVVDSPVRPFTWAMDMLAVGSGVGYNIQKHHVDKLPAVKSWFKAPVRMDDGGADFIVPDSREGWVKLLGKTLKAAFLSNNPQNGTFTYSTQIIRSKGAPIKGFGGTASGPEDLVWGINQIALLLEDRRGKKIRPIDALDIMNIIGHIIVAGNVRRSAQIAIGDPDDVEFLLAKRWDMGTIPKWRAMSNNSVACDDIKDLHPFFWQGYEGRGEPYGIINLPLSRACGRLGEVWYPDPRVEGYNPCAEQSLEAFETCCLSEVFLPNIESLEELKDACELLYRINKHAMTLNSHLKETEKVVHENYRMGIGMTGLMQATEEQLSWLDPTYKYLRAFDKKYSEKNDLPASIKLTTVKPSGTLSLLPGVTPGIHPGFSQYMYRRITIASEHPLTAMCREKGYPVEFKKQLDGTEDFSSCIVTFPFKYADNTVMASDMTALKQLEMIQKLQTIWSDNSVSCTVYYTKEEIPQIKAYLEKNYKTKHKSLSFMLHSEHGFEQAPYEEITKEQYDELVARVEPITEIESVDFELQDECAGGMCPVR